MRSDALLLGEVGAAGLGVALAGGLGGAALGADQGLLQLAQGELALLDPADEGRDVPGVLVGPLGGQGAVGLRLRGPVLVGVAARLQSSAWVIRVAAAPSATAATAATASTRDDCRTSAPSTSAAAAVTSTTATVRRVLR